MTSEDSSEKTRQATVPSEEPVEPTPTKTAPMPAGLIGIAPYFMVRDLARALNYYCDVLGFARPHLWGEPPTSAMPQRDGFVVMLY